jgi:hypothetical protein
MEITQGTWSEVVIANGIAMVSGKVVVQATDEKNSPTSEIEESLACYSRCILYL